MVCVMRCCTILQGRPCIWVRSKFDILPSTLPRTSRYTLTILKLSRRLYHMKHYLINRVNSFICKSSDIPFHYMRENYVKPINSIPHTYKKFSRMVTKFPTSRTQILRAANHLINWLINLMWQVSALDLSSTNKVFKLSLENDNMIKLNITRQSLARHRTINLLPWPRTNDYNYHSSILRNN